MGVMPIKLKRLLGAMSRKGFLAILRGTCLLSLSPYAWNQETAEWKIRVSAMSASVRLKPDLESPVIATLPKETSLNSHKAEGDWFRVVLPPGKDGIVIIGYIAKSEVQGRTAKISAFQGSERWTRRENTLPLSTIEPVALFLRLLN
jgi:hypothetical protein